MTIPNDLPWISTKRKLGSGGQGTVHLVTHKDNQCEELFALKELHNTDSHQARERFRKEIETVSKFKHPSIIKVLDYSKEDDEFQFYVMEYHQNAKTLSDTCFLSNPNPFHGKTLKCLDLFEQIITAIQVCESQSPPIIHRDISPNNILVLQDHSICLIDFGLCHTVGDSTITLAGENIGTRNYAPPECGSGSQFQLGTHSDIYSAAKVLWSTITSERAFDREAPIFNNKSMENMFPYNEETWHLNRILGESIQDDPARRFAKTELVLSQIAEVRYAIKGGFPPLEAISTRCPSCGLKSVKKIRNGQQVFGNYMDRDLAVNECVMCGFIFVRRSETLTKNTEKQSQ